MSKKPFDPSARLQTLIASLPPEVHSLIDDLTKPDTPLETLPGGASVLELMEQVSEPVSLQLRLFSDTLGVSHFHSRAFVFEPEVKNGERRWVSNTPRFADPHCFLAEPDDLLSALAAWQTEAAPESESVALWLHGVEVGDRSLFLVVARHSEGTLAQFLVRNGTWARAPLGEASLRMLLQMELRKTPRARDFWGQALGTFAAELAAARTPGLVTALKAVGASSEELSELSDGQAAEIVQALLANEGGLRAVQSLCRKVAHGPLVEAQELLEVLAGLLEQTAKALQDQVTKSRKEQAAATKRLQSSLERQRTLYEGIKQRADRLAAENARLRVAPPPGNATPKRSLQDSVNALLEGC